MDRSARRQTGFSGLLIDLIRRPVTGSLVFASIAASLLFWSGYSIAPLTMDHDEPLTQPWRFLTSVFPHVNLFHLAFNLYWISYFGMRVEEELGSFRTAALLAVFAVGSSAAEFAFFHGGVGLSGIGYGLFGMLWALSRRDSRFKGVVDGPTTGLFVGWFVLCVVLTWADVWRIGNVAHGVGALLGYLAGQAITAPSGHALPWRAALAVGVAGTVALASVGRRYVNVGGEMAGVFLRQALAAWKEEDYEAAAELYRASLRHDETYAGSFNLGLALDRLGRTGEALEMFDRAARIDPDANEAHGGRGRCLAKLGRYDEALEALDRALLFAPDDVADLGNRGSCLAELGRFEEALEALDRTLELDPDNAWALGKRGRCLGELERFDEALEAFDRAIALDPDDAADHESRGWCLAQMGRFEEALEALDRALELDPDDAWTLRQRGWCLGELNRRREGVEVLTRAIELDPSNAWAVGMHGRYLAELARYDEALVSLQEAIALDPDDAAAHGNRGWCLAELGRFEEALEALDRTAELDPDDAWTLSMRGWCQHELRRFAEARRDLSRALELDPEDTFARDLLDLIRNGPSQD